MEIYFREALFYLKQLGKFVLRRTPVWWLRLPALSDTHELDRILEFAKVIAWL